MAADAASTVRPATRRPGRSTSTAFRSARVLAATTRALRRLYSPRSIRPRPIAFSSRPSTWERSSSETRRSFGSMAGPLIWKGYPGSSQGWSGTGIGSSNGSSSAPLGVAPGPAARSAPPPVSSQTVQDRAVHPRDRSPDSTTIPVLCSACVAPNSSFRFWARSEAQSRLTAPCATTAAPPTPVATISADHPVEALAALLGRSRRPARGFAHRADPPSSRRSAGGSRAPTRRRRASPSRRRRSPGGHRERGPPARGPPPTEPPSTAPGSPSRRR